MKAMDKLIKVAKLTRENAYVCKTEHKIGASVLTRDGKIFGGCNIESNISGLGICAERTAIMNAILTGRYEFEALLVYDIDYIIPCGACLQFLTEFKAISQKEIVITSYSERDEDFVVYTITELLPRGYESKNTEKVESYRGKHEN